MPAGNWKLRFLAGGNFFDWARWSGVSRLRMIDEHDADILAWHLADCLAVALQDELLVANGQMSRLALISSVRLLIIVSSAEEKTNLPWLESN